MCLRPYHRDGNEARSGCEASCPGRRGYRRRDVAEELRAGRLVRGVHPQSRLITEAVGHAVFAVEQRRVTAFELARCQSGASRPDVRLLLQAFTALQTAMTWHDWLGEYQAGVYGMAGTDNATTEEAAPGEAPRPSRAPQPESEPSEAGFRIR